MNKFKITIISGSLGLVSILTPGVNAKDLHPTYSKAKSSLDEHNYVLYRIVDKLSRANNMADFSWRVKLTQQYNLNGFADQANLIVVPIPMMDQLSGDPDAIGCLVGREMSHHIRKHKAIGPAEEEAIKNKITKEVLASKQKNDKSKRGWGLGLGLVGGILGVNTGGIQGSINKNTDAATQKMVQEKLSAMKRLQKDSQLQIDSEADEDAFVFLARAGRDPKGCIRYLDLISRDPNAEIDSNSPQIPNRIAAYRRFIEENSKDEFTREGQSNLSKNSKPLEFARSADNQSLRIESSRGSTSSQMDSF